MKNYKIFLKDGHSANISAHGHGATVGLGMFVLRLLDKDDNVIAIFWEPAGFIVEGPTVEALKQAGYIAEESGSAVEGLKQELQRVYALVDHWSNEARITRIHTARECADALDGFGYEEAAAAIRGKYEIPAGA